MNSAVEKNWISCFPFSVEFWKSYYKYIIMHSIVNKDVYENFSLKKWDKYLDFSTSLKKKNVFWVENLPNKSVKEVFFNEAFHV